MNERIRSIDAIRGLAILGVILIHTTTRTLEASNFDLVGFSWTLFLNQAMRYAVPLFIIISGFVLEVNKKEENYWTFIKRRFSKIFIPYIFWSLIYYFFIYTNNKDNLFKVLLTGNASYQFYFIPALLIFYLTFPLLHKLIHKYSNKVILATSSFVGIILLTKNYYFTAFDLGDEINAMILSYVYFVFGVLGANNKLIIDKITKKFKLFLFIPAVLSMFYIVWEGKTRYLLTGNYLSYYSQWRPSVFIYTIFIALALYYLFEKTNLNNSFISRFSKHSFFVFFVHVMILEIFWKFFGLSFFTITGTSLGKIIFDPMFFICIAFVSFILSKTTHKIAKTSKLVG